MEWLMSMPPGHFTTWNDLSGAFLAKYFPPARTAKIRHELATFTQRDGETLYDAWERNKDLQRQCPHHRIPDWLVLENFYNGLDQSVRSALDAAAGGSLMGKSEVDARQLIEDMALHNYQYGNPRGRTRGVLEVDAVQLLTAKMDQLSHKFDNMQVHQTSTSNHSCGACGMMGHQSSECLQVNAEASLEGVYAFNARNSGNQYSSNYNSNWRNTGMYPSSNTSFTPQPLPNQNCPPGFSPHFSNTAFQNPPQVQPPAPQKSQTDELLEQLLKRDQEKDQKFQRLFTEIDQLRAHNKMLESQITQMSASTSQRDYGKLPSQPEANPRAGVNAITLRSGKQLDAREPEEKDSRQDPLFSPQAPEVSAGKPSVIDVEIEKEYVAPAPYCPPLPFPQRIQKSKLEKQYGRFLSNLQKLSINVPFLEALSQMPSYAKFLKELLSNKRNLEEVETVALTKISSGGIQNKLPQKLQDPGSFSIPCFIGNFEIRKALCDLGASVSLIPLSICKKLEMGEPKPTRMTLQMADRSIKHPVGIVEDVPLKVGKFFIPVDFVVLDMEEDNQTPIILGRPFLATAGAMIDMRGGKLTFRIGDETAEFNVFHATKFPHVTDSCFCVDIVDRIVEEEMGEFWHKDPFGAEFEDGTDPGDDTKARPSEHKSKKAFEHRKSRKSASMKWTPKTKIENFQ